MFVIHVIELVPHSRTDNRIGAAGFETFVQSLLQYTHLEQLSLNGVAPFNT